MSLKHGFNRIGHLLNDGVEKSQKAIGVTMEKEVKRTAMISRRVREQVDDLDLPGVEERFVTHMRENPIPYLVGAAILIAALVARLVKEARDARDFRRTPLL